MAVTVLDSGNGKTIAEVFEQGSDAVVARYKNRPDAWHGFVDWYKKSSSVNAYWILCKIYALGSAYRSRTYHLLFKRVSHHMHKSIFCAD